MKILVTGGAGFIGSPLTHAPIAKGHQVMIIDDLSSGNRKFISPRAKLAITDLHDYKKIESVFRKFKPSAVFHLAAQIDIRSAFPDRKLYATDSMNILRLCQTNGVQRLIFSSSAAVYGASKRFPLAEILPSQPVSGYGFSKANFEMHLASRYRSDKIKAVVLRYANVYGPRQGTVGEGGVVAIFCKRLLQKQPLIIFGDGRQTRDFIFVKDVVESNLKALRSKKSWAVYNVSTQKETNINTLAKKLMRISAVKISILRKSAIKGEAKRSALSNGKIKKELGWSPDVSLDEGLERTWQWFVNNYQESKRQE